MALVLVICGVVVLVFRSRQPNMPPIAALRLDALDAPKRVATISDSGSHDPDGTVRSWRIAWGDGKEDNLASMPQKTAHTYASEGEYTISLWCVDNKGATSSVPAMTNITFDFLKRQKAIEQAQAETKRQAEAKAEADRLKAEQAKKEAERLAQEKQKELAAQQARKAREQQELEKKRLAEADLVRQKREEPAKAPAPPPPTPLAAALSDNPSFREIIYTPAGHTLGQFQISKEKTEGMGRDGKLPVILVIRCVNFPNSPIPTSDWQIDGKNVQLQAGRIRAALSPGRHDVTAFLTRQAGTGPTELKADVTVEPSGDCIVEPRN